MDHQGSCADNEFNNKRRETRKEQFLGPMEELILRQRLKLVITPHYPKASGPKLYPSMLRIHCLQQWYGMSDPAMEDALYEIVPMRLFAGLSLRNTRLITPPS